MLAWILALSLAVWLGWALGARRTAARYAAYAELQTSLSGQTRAVRGLRLTRVTVRRDE